MRSILIIGAGRSSAYLIEYLLKHAQSGSWKVTVADSSLELARSGAGNHTHSIAIQLDIRDRSALSLVVRKHEIVVSMLPPNFHPEVAKECLAAGKHLVTASYVSEEMAALDTEAKEKGLIFLNEVGLDPGIDHMSAMEVIERIRSEKGELISFKSWCGGLVAPSSNDNPWGYKFSWNPRNVILAGKGVARYREEGKLKFVPYERLFSDAEKVNVAGHGMYEGYLNRDSLTYLKPYGIEDVETMKRGTLRMRGFCEAWNALIRIGLTDDSWNLPNKDDMTWPELISSFLPEGKGSLKQRLANFLEVSASSQVIKKLEWLEIFRDKRIISPGRSPAQALQILLEEKWKLKERDKDMILMQHEFIYKIKGKKRTITSTLIEEGKDPVHTAMARTVGLPLAIAVRLIALNKIRSRGVLIPILPEFYVPVMKELAELGIRFRETQKLR